MFTIQIILVSFTIFLFQFRNPQKDFIHVVSAFVFLNLMFPDIFFILSIEKFFATKLLAVGLVLGLIISYYLRFRRKEIKKNIDYIKWVGILLILLIPLSIFSFESSFFPIIRTLGMLTYPVLAVIYIVDRFILKQEG